MLRRYQRRLSRGSGGGGGGGIRGWDRSFLAARARTEECRVDGAAVAAYFPLDRVLKGVSALFGRVLDVTVEEEAMAPGEAWAPGVRKLRVTAGGGGGGHGGGGAPAMGHVYLDLDPRPRKFAHAAHFVVRCSRRLPGERVAVQAQRPKA